jgi:hypothetical protein
MNSMGRLTRTLPWPEGWGRMDGTKLDRGTLHLPWTNHGLTILVRRTRRLMPGRYTLEGLKIQRFR